MKFVGLAIAISVALFVGLLVVRSGSDPSNAEAVGSVPADDQPVESTSLPKFAPETAAAEAVGLTGEVVTSGLITRRELIESFATPEFGRELADLTSEQMKSLRLSFTEAGHPHAVLSAAEFPLRVHTLERDDSTARVQVWSVLIVAVTEDPVARQAWRTVTVDLELMDGLWLVAGWQSTDGPYPVTLPASPVATSREIADRLEWMEAG